MIETRRATAADLRPLSAALARAFADDPVTTWIIGGRPGPLRRFFATELRHYLRRGEVLTSADGARGAALWARPDAWRLSVLDTLRQAPGMIAALGPRIPRGLRALTVIERAHPREPHWYLALLGTDPSAQGQGVGGALMQPILDRCDRSGAPAYLESSKEQNIPYYERFGFKVTGEIVFPKGPTMWPMWREAVLVGTPTE